MNLDYFITKYCGQTKYNFTKDNYIKFLKDMKDYFKDIKKEVVTSCKSNYVTSKDIDKLIDKYNKTKGNKKVTFKKYTNDEIKDRTKIHNKAVDVFSNMASELVIRDHVLSSFSTDFKNVFKKDFDRATLTILQYLPKTREEEIDILTRLSKLDEVDPTDKITNREYVKRFVMNGFERIKNDMRKLATCPSNDKILEYAKNNPTMFHVFLDLDGNKISQINKDLNLGISKEFEDEWTKTYAKYSNDIGNYREQIGEMANPLYPEHNCTDIAILYKNLIENDDSLFERYGIKNDPDNPDRINPLFHANSVGFFMDSYNFNQYSKIRDPFSGTKRNIKNSIELNLLSNGLNNDIKNYKFLNNKKEEVSLDDALVNIAKGEKHYLVDKNKNYVMDLIVDPYRTYNSITSSSRYEELDFNKIYDKYPNNNQKNKDKIKNECDKEIKNKLKDIYKSVSKENPWYVKNKGNALYTKAQNELEKIMNAPIKDKGDLVDRLLYVKNIADNYLSDKIKQNPPKNDKHSLKREEEMRQLSSSIKRMVNPLLDLRDKENGVRKESLLQFNNKKQIEINEVFFDDKQKNTEISKDITNNPLEIDANQLK